MLELDKKQKIAIGIGAGLCIAGGAFALGWLAHDKKISLDLLNIAHEVADGGAKSMSAVHTSGAKINMLFFGEKGVPKDAIKALKEYTKTAAIQ